MSWYGCELWQTFQVIVWESRWLSPSTHQIFDLHVHKESLETVGARKNGIPVTFLLCGFRVIFAEALSNFCESILEYVSNNRGSGDPHISKTTFATEICGAYDILYGHWLQTRDMKVSFLELLIKAANGYVSGGWPACSCLLFAIRFLMVERRQVTFFTICQRLYAVNSFSCSYAL